MVRFSASANKHSYIHGAMNGEICLKYEQDKRQLETFVLV